MSGKYELPTELTVVDRYGRPVLLGFLVLLFAASLAAFLYLKMTSVTLDATETLYDGQDCSVIVLHQAVVRPAQTKSPIIAKVVSKPTLTTTLPVTVTLTELNPGYVMLQGEQRKSFILPTHEAQMQSSFDVINSKGMPDELLFQVTVEIGSRLPIDNSISIKVTRLSVEQYAALSAIVTGILSGWILFGKQLLSAIFKRRENGNV